MENKFKKLGLLTLIGVILFSISLFSINLYLDEDAETSKETVVILHGLGKSKNTMWLLAKRLKDAGYAVKRIDYKSLFQETDDVINNVDQQINACCANFQQPTHFVGHSLGGLLIRSYLDTHKVPNLGRVVLIGTPNGGSEVVDTYKDIWWMKFAGQMANTLSTKDQTRLMNLPAPYYKIGIIAGIADKTPFSNIIPGKDDGLVSVKSTIITGMTDFIVLNSLHPLMNFDSTVAIQTIEFLKNAKFVKNVPTT